MTFPLDFAIMSHPSDRHLSPILHWRQLREITPGRGRVQFTRCSPFQRFMAALCVVLADKRVKALLLGFQRRCRRPQHGFFQRPMHALMSAILIRPAGFNALGTDAQPNLPGRQPTQPTHRQRGKGGAVVGPYSFRQSVLPKDPFEPRPNLSPPRSLQSSALQEITAEVVRHRQRVTAPAIAQHEIAFEVRAPEGISAVAVEQRLAVRRHPPTAATRTHQTRPLQNLTPVLSAAQATAGSSRRNPSITFFGPKR
jgi:hypothetical protein